MSRRAVVVWVPRRFVALFPLISVIAAVVATSIAAQGASVDKFAAQPRWDGIWQPPPYNAKGWDWVRLDSGEWIKGEIFVMRDFRLHFDSDEFNLVEIEWKDVVEILTERVYTVVLDDMKTTHTGTIAMRGASVSVDVGGRIVTFDRGAVLAITPNANRELSLWNARGSIGLGLRSGNTDESDISGKLTLGREAEWTRFQFEYDGAYGSLDNQKNTNNHRGRSQFDYFLSRDLFLTPAAFEVYSDEFQNISYRLTPTGGIGYYLARRSALEWQARIGAGYQRTRFDSVVVGDSSASDNGAIVASTTIDLDLTSRVDLILEYQIQLIAPETDQTSHHSDVTFEIKLTSALDLDISFVWDRIERPDPDSSGRRPDSNDFRTSVGLAIEY